MDSLDESTYIINTLDSLGGSVTLNVNKLIDTLNAFHADQNLNRGDLFFILIVSKIQTSSTVIFVICFTLFIESIILNIYLWSLFQIFLHANWIRNEIYN
jgi:hypothetical protein